MNRFWIAIMMPLTVTSTIDQMAAPSETAASSSGFVCPVIATSVKADLIHASARHLGRALERDFGLRASRPIAEFVTRIFELTPRMTERQARRQCGWNQAKPPELPR